MRLIKLTRTTPEDYLIYINPEHITSMGSIYHPKSNSTLIKLINGDTYSVKESIETIIEQYTAHACNGKVLIN